MRLCRWERWGDRQCRSCGCACYARGSIALARVGRQRKERRRHRSDSFRHDLRSTTCVRSGAWGCRRSSAKLSNLTAACAFALLPSML
eukprot:795744-Heterocapsa_arctica.AAC.1